MLMGMQIYRLSALILCALLPACGGALCQTSSGNRAAAEKLHFDARQLMNSGRFAEAITLEERAVELDPDNASIHRGLTTIYEQLHRTKQALQEAARAAELEPNNAASHYNLGIVLSEIRQFPQAVNEYQKAIALGKNDLDTRRMLYQCMARTSRLKEAIAGLESMSRDFPKSKEVWLDLSDAYFIYGDGDGALEAAHRSAELDPHWYPAVRFQATVAAGTRRWGIALLLCKQLVEMDPKVADGYSLAASLFSQTDFQLGEWFLTQALQYQKNNAGLLTDLGKRYLKLATTSPPGAKSKVLTERDLHWLKLSEKALGAAVAAAPNDVVANYQLSRALCADRKTQEALPFIRKAYQLCPSDPGIKALYMRSNSADNDLAGLLRRWLHGS